MDNGASPASTGEAAEQTATTRARCRFFDICVSRLLAAIADAARNGGTLIFHLAERVLAKRFLGRFGIGAVTLRVGGVTEIKCRYEANIEKGSSNSSGYILL